MLNWSIEKKELQLLYTWKISRNASDSKTNLFVRVSDGIHEGTGEVAPNIRYGESPGQAETEFATFFSSGPGDFISIDALRDRLHSASLSRSLRFGIESAWIHYTCAKEKIEVSRWLGLEPVNSVPISFSIPIMETGKMRAFYDQHNLKRFRYIKIKVNAEEMADAVGFLSTFCTQSLFVDANEAFSDVEHCIRTLEKLKRKNIALIEQPMPAKAKDESVYLKRYSPFPLFADESVTDEADFGELKKMFNGINVKLMKAGGYLNAVGLLKDARRNGMKTMIGCMVETTLAISSGLHLCSLADYVDLDSFLVLKNEPFGLVTEENGLILFKDDMKEEDR